MLLLIRIQGASVHSVTETVPMNSKDLWKRWKESGGRKCYLISQW